MTFRAIFSSKAKHSMYNKFLFCYSIPYFLFNIPLVKQHLFIVLLWVTVEHFFLLINIALKYSWYFPLPYLSKLTLVAQLQDDTKIQNVTGIKITYHKYPHIKITILSVWPIPINV